VYALDNALTIAPLPPITIEPLVRAALIEELDRAGDITSDALVPAEARAETALVARHTRVLAGLDAALSAFDCRRRSIKLEEATSRYRAAVFFVPAFAAR
jgi:nicotinate-nucleotide pyrophosphorylase (carboxylating)